MWKPFGLVGMASLKVERTLFCELYLALLSRQVEEAYSFQDLGMVQYSNGCPVRMRLCKVLIGRCRFFLDAYKYVLDVLISTEDVSFR